MQRATWIRLSVTILLLGAVAVGFASGSLHRAYVTILMALIWLAVPLLLAATESEELPANCRVPRSPLLATLVAPWLPGGGRGALYLVLHMALAASAMWILRAVVGEPTTRVFHLGITCAFATVYVLVPCALAGRGLNAPGTRLAVRCAIPVFMLACWIAAAFITRNPNDSVRALIAQILSPHELGELITGNGKRFVGHPLALPILAGLTAIAVIANAPRMARGVRAVLARSREARGL